MSRCCWSDATHKSSLRDTQTSLSPPPPCTQTLKHLKQEAEEEVCVITIREDGQTHACSALDPVRKYTHTVTGGVDPCSGNWPVKAALSASRRLHT